MSVCVPMVLIHENDGKEIPDHCMVMVGAQILAFMIPRVVTDAFSISLSSFDSLYSLRDETRVPGNGGLAARPISNAEQDKEYE
jgi:hypothetical protein